MRQPARARPQPQRRRLVVAAIAPALRLPAWRERAALRSAPSPLPWHAVRASRSAPRAPVFAPGTRASHSPCEQPGSSRKLPGRLRIALEPGLGRPWSLSTGQLSLPRGQAMLLLPSPQRFLLGPFSAASGPDGCGSKYFEVVPSTQTVLPLPRPLPKQTSSELFLFGKFPIRKMEVSGARCGA